MRLTLSYRPTEKQARFHRCAADEALYGGAAGGGKTRALVMEALARCLEKPGMQAYLFRRTYPELEDTLIAEARACIPRELGSYHATRRELNLVNGSTLRFRACQRDADRFRYQGAQMHSLFIDELTHFPLEVYDYLKTRLRAPKALGIRPVVRATANPGGVGHAWVKQRFIDAGRPGHVHTVGRPPRTVLYLPATAYDNPHLNPEYIDELKQKPPALRKALLEGDWNAFEGQVFGEFRNDEAGYQTGIGTHVIAPFPIPPHYPRYRAFDFGYARPFAVLWFAIDEDGRAILYREWYGCTGVPDEGLRMPPRQIAREIARVERTAGEPSVLGIADPSIWDGSRGESIAAQMEEEGVYFIPGNNARLPGKMQLHYRLGMDREGKPGLWVFEACRGFIRTIAQLTYSSLRPEDVDTAAEDHIYDAARYFLMEKPVTPVKPQAVRRVFNPLEG